MGTRVEMRFFREQPWMPVGFELKPGIPGTTFSDNSTGERQIHRITCAGDNTHTLIERSTAGADMSIGRDLRVIATKGFEEVAKVTTRTGPYEMKLQPDRVPIPVTIRITHAP